MSLSPSPKATFDVPSPAAILNTCRSLPLGDIFNILPPNHWATYMLPLLSIFMLSGPSHHETVLFFVRTFSRAKFHLLLNEPSLFIVNFFMQLPTVSLTYRVFWSRESPIPMA